MEHALTLHGVTKRFGSFTAVSDLTLEVPKGCIYGFLGQNGAGKTTTIRMVMSIFRPDAGTISVLGQPDAAAIKDRLGYLPEEKGLYKKMKTAEIVAYFGKLKGMDRSTANLRARELLTRYGLGEWLDKRCEAMSKGMSKGGGRRHGGRRGGNDDQPHQASCGGWWRWPARRGRRGDRRQHPETGWHRSAEQPQPGQPGPGWLVHHL